MMLEPIALLTHYSLPASGVIHVGANFGQEFPSYKSIRVATAVYVEPISHVFKVLKDTVEKEPGHHAVQAVCSDRSGVSVDFNIANNEGQSSSMLPLGHHSELYPHISYVGKETHVTTTLDDLIASNFPDRKFDALVIDTQGADLLVLKGAVKTLRQIESIHIEVSDVPVYEGGCTLEEIRAFLEPQGFKLKYLSLWQSGGEWGTAFFMKVDPSTRPVNEVLNGVRVDRFLVPPSVDLREVAALGAVDPAEIHAVLDRVSAGGDTFPLARLAGAGDDIPLMPDDLAGIEACFSPGVQKDKTLEDLLAREHGIKSFLCNYKADAERLSTPLMPELQTFEKKWVGTQRNEMYLDFNDWVKDNASAGADLLLHMNMGGYEYRNLLYVDDAVLSRFRVIVLDLHRLDLIRKPVFFYAVFKPVLEKILGGFSCVRSSPKSTDAVELAKADYLPKILELTFVRKDRF